MTTVRPAPLVTGLDGLLRRTARRFPERAALVGGEQVIGYAALDALVTRHARALRATLGEEPVVVAISSALDIDYVVAYYAAMRAGHVALPVNPLLPEPALRYQLRVSRARHAFVTEPVARRLDRIGNPVTSTLIGGGRLLESVRPVPGPEFDAAVREVDPDSVAALHFTSGTTGNPKAVRLSHRNLVSNAAQVAEAHRLGPDTVSVIAFPTYHPMHLNSAVHAGASQVLTDDPDLGSAVDLAVRHHATHLYSIPAWLIRYDRTGPAGKQRPDRLRFVASGGTALPVATADRLRSRLGVPVVQGYGLAETSPLTHFDDPDDPAPGSVGRPLTDTECRVVGVDDRRPVAAGESGEIQVRGPQVMLGYLDHDGPDPVDQAGWLSTGDVGYQDDQGRLFLVDRLKDVFKHDNWLVSPAEIEAVLAADPEVEECVVVDRPDEVHGGTAYAYLVLRAGSAGPAAVHRILSRVNAGLPYYKHIRHAESVPEIPRSPNGKVARRELRSALHAATKGGSTVVILINRFTLTASPDRFEEVFEASSVYMRQQPGFIQHTLVKSLRDANVYVNIAHWADAASHLRVVQSAGFREHIEQLAEVARAEPDLFAVVRDVEPAGR